MLSHIEYINCLIVEDDKFKLDRVKEHLREIFGSKTKISVCHALSTATLALSEQMFDVVIIDMSIPSHEPEVGAGSPFPLPSGGLDVLFEIDYLKHSSSCIILTQYTDIEIEGLLIPVDLAAAEILEKFGIKVAGCVQYFENENGWKFDVSRILGKL